MNTFLSQVAEDMLDRIPKGEIVRTVVVLPSQRASIYLNRELSRLSHGPIFSPRYVSLLELSCQMTGLRKADQIVLTCLLYDTYRSVLEESGETAEEIDDFLPWAEMMLRDFSQMDQYGVNAEALLKNLTELHDLDSFDYLTEDQVKALQNFFDDFSPERMSSLKTSFQKVWNHLGKIYGLFRERLLEKGIGYSGLITRQAAASDVLPEDVLHVVFAGHGALSQSEISLMKRLKEHLDCLFYWDIDPRYLEGGHEAGYFIRHNIRELGSALDVTRRQEGPSPKVRIVSVGGNLLQGRLTTSWLREVQEKGYTKRQCAVILPDERLLPTVLHSIPRQVSDVNITMGYPLSHTLPHSFLALILGIQLNRLLDAPAGNQAQRLMELERHPLYPFACGNIQTDVRKSYESGTDGPDDLLGQVLHAINDRSSFLCRLKQLIEGMMARIRLQMKDIPWMDADLSLESLWRCHKAVDRLEGLMRAGSLMVGTVTLLRLLLRLMAKESIPFHSEMDQGYQVMGVLESRAMDFEHILLLSMNEEYMPKGHGAQPSYLPESLRKAFGLPSRRELSALYAYTFYRLLRRARTVTLAYNATVSGIENGQMSRYLLQILLDGGFDVLKEHLTLGGEPLKASPLSFKKTAWMQDKLIKKYSLENERMSYLSPSALNCYLDCKLKFCLNYLYGLRKDSEPLEDVDAALFGTIFHKAAENAYTCLTEEAPYLSGRDLDKVSDYLLDKCVGDALREELLDKPEGAILGSSGIILLIRQVIKKQLRDTLRIDLSGPDLKVTGMEKEVYDSFLVPVNGGDIPVRVGGFIDHEDESEGVLRITDYKTGGEDEKPKSIGELFSRKETNRAYRDFQILLYCLLEKRKGYPGPIRPQLLYLRQLHDREYVPNVQLGKDVMTDFTPYAQEMEDHLTSLLAEIFSLEDIYEPTDNPKHCALCDFRRVCELRKVATVEEDE